MPKRVQLYRQPPATAAQFLGLEGEIIVETETFRMHLHDGATPGGFTFVSLVEIEELIESVPNADTENIWNEKNTFEGVVEFKNDVQFPEGTMVRGTTGFLGVGMTPTQAVDVTHSVNDAASIKLRNPNDGNFAYGRLLVDNGNSNGGIAHFGSSFTSFSQNRANGTQVFASGDGGLTLNTSVNQPIYLGVNNNEIARLTANGVGIGKAPQEVLDIEKSQNAVTRANLHNESSGTAASVRWGMTNSVSYSFIELHGSGYTPINMRRADGMVISSSGEGGLSVFTRTNTPLYFGVENTEHMRMTHNGVLITINNSSSWALHLKQTDTGDPAVLYEIDGGVAFTTGIDNSDSDKFKISRSGTLGTNDEISIDPSTGVITTHEQLQCAGPLHINNNFIRITPQTLTGGNNLAITSSLVIITNNTNISGMVAKPHGTIVRLFNASAQDLTILNGNANSTDVNRFSMADGNYDLRNGEGADFFYNTIGDLNRWQLLTPRDTAF